MMGAVLQPTLYLLGIGIGVGELVDQGTDSAELLGGASYFAFYSSALLATTAMFTSLSLTAIVERSRLTRAW